MKSMKPIRIAHVAYILIPGWGRFDTINELLRNGGFDVWIIWYIQNWSCIKHKILGNIEVDLKNKIINITIPRWLVAINVLINQFILDGIGYAIPLYIICKKLKMKAIILQDYMIEVNFFFLLFKKIFRLKISTIIDYHDLIARWAYYNSKNKLKKLLEPFHVAIDEVINPKLAGKIIAVTNFLKNFIFHRSKINKGLVIPEVFKSPYQIEVNYDKNELRRKLGLNPHSVILIWAGALGGFAVDDILFLIRAISLSRNKNKILLLLLAWGASKDTIITINNFAKEVGVNIKYLGYIDNRKLLYWEYLMASDIGVFIRPRTLFSHALTGRKVQDYIGVGLPVIVPCLAGQLEIIKQNGLCYKPEDVLDLAKKIDEILNLDLISMGMKSRKIANSILNYVKNLILSEDFKNFLIN